MELTFTIAGGADKKADNEFLFASYAVTDGEVACINPNSFNVANGVGGITAVTGSITNTGDLVPAENGKFTATQEVKVSVDDFLAGPHCEGEVNDPDGLCTREQLEVGGARLAEAWALDQDTDCNNNWTMWGVLPTEFDITLVFQKNCDVDGNGVPDQDSCDPAKRVKIISCTTDPPVELRHIIDGLVITDPSEPPLEGQEPTTVEYTCS
jgi:hypothetical protein